MDTEKKEVLTSFLLVFSEIYLKNMFGNLARQSTLGRREVMVEVQARTLEHVFIFAVFCSELDERGPDLSLYDREVSEQSGRAKVT